MNDLNKVDFTDFPMVCRDYSEFSGLSLEQVQVKVNEVVDFWKAAEIWNKNVKEETNEEILNFYARTNYIYHIMTAYCPERHSKLSNYLSILDFVRDHFSKNAGAEIMEFGGGIGQLCRGFLPAHLRRTAER